MTAGGGASSAAVALVALGVAAVRILDLAYFANSAAPRPAIGQHGLVVTDGTRGSQ
jgi:hypothetical protein